MESRTFARPKELDRFCLMGGGSYAGIGMVGCCFGKSRGLVGISAGRRPDCARNDSAVIQSTCRSADTVVNFRARAGVSMRIERL